MLFGASHIRIYPAFRQRCTEFASRSSSYCTLVSPSTSLCQLRWCPRRGRAAVGNSLQLEVSRDLASTEARATKTGYFRFTGAYHSVSTPNTLVVALLACCCYRAWPRSSHRMKRHTTGIAAWYETTEARLLAANRRRPKGQMTVLCNPISGLNGGGKLNYAVDCKSGVPALNIR
jgi:hypothetical protein